jgi:hypothetical protein
MLANDTLGLIFLYSSYKEILVLSQVSTRFHALAENPHLWQAKLMERIGRETKRDPKQFFKACLRAGQGYIMDMLHCRPIHDPLLMRRDIYRLDSSIVEGHQWITCVTASHHCRVSYNGKQACIGRAEDALIYACGESAFIATYYKGTVQIMQFDEKIERTKIWYKHSNVIDCKLIGMTVFIQEYCLKLVYTCDTRTVVSSIGLSSEVVYMEGRDVYLGIDRGGYPAVQKRPTYGCMATTHGLTVHYRDGTLYGDSKVIDTGVLWVRDTCTTMELCYVKGI